MYYATEIPKGSRTGNAAPAQLRSPVIINAEREEDYERTVIKFLIERICKGEG